jgi:hypothetical protein
VHVDRTACPWLIKRFVDPKAEFVFVPIEKIEEIVKKENAIPYDAPNVELGHHGEKCSFDSIFEKYKIETQLSWNLLKSSERQTRIRWKLFPKLQGWKQS